MPAYIQNIATAVPEGSFTQPYLRDKMKKYISGRPATKRIIHSLYSKSGIDKRHTVVKDFHSNGHPQLFFKRNGVMAEPSTQTRNELYIKYAKQFYGDIAKKLLRKNETISKDDITHVITISCTGFFAPEPAYEIVKQLGLSPSTERYHIGFMGCFAVFPALKMAHTICEANPDATVMIVSVELCTLHLQSSDDPDNLISASVFADGAAGATITAKKSAVRRKGYRIEKFQTAIAEGSEQDMAWTIGDAGFDMVLSTYVPDIIQSNFKDAIAPLFEAFGLNYSDIAHWAVHPGGRAILDKVDQSLQLQPRQIEPSRTVLAQYGNMSSATILFVLQELLQKEPVSQEERVVAMAFGPGLTIESSLLTKLS